MNRVLKALLVAMSISLTAGVGLQSRRCFDGSLTVEGEVKCPFSWIQAIASHSTGNTDLGDQVSLTKGARRQKIDLAHYKLTLLNINYPHAGVVHVKALMSSFAVNFHPSNIHNVLCPER